MPVCQLRSRDHGAIDPQTIRLIIAGTSSLCGRTHTHHAISKTALDYIPIITNHGLEPHTIGRIVKEMEHIGGTKDPMITSRACIPLCAYPRSGGFPVTGVCSSSTWWRFGCFISHRLTVEQHNGLCRPSSIYSSIQKYCIFQSHVSARGINCFIASGATLFRSATTYPCRFNQAILVLLVTRVISDVLLPMRCKWCGHVALSILLTSTII
jgi:hypothetical protein